MVVASCPGASFVALVRTDEACRTPFVACVALEVNVFFSKL